MPRDTSDHGPGASPSAAERWGTWLNAVLASKGLKPVDLLRLAEANPPRRGKPPSRATVFSWASKTQPASVDNAIYVARLLRVDSLEALRAAEHYDVVEEITSRSQGPANTGATAVDDGLALLRASDLPPELKKQFEQEYLSMVVPMAQATEALKDKLARELDRALAAQERHEEDGEGPQRSAAG